MSGGPHARRLEQRLERRGGAVELLRLPAALYGAAVWVRGAAYDCGLAPVARAGVPVVSAGNLSAGGTGKTPFCAFLARELAARGFRPGLLSRGYGAQAGAANDEALLLARLCPHVPHVQERERARGAQRLVALGADAIVLDDGFQHRRLHRDLDYVLVDATRPWGLPRTAGGAVRALLPRGLLREPPRALARADLIVLTRCDQAGAQDLERLEAELARCAPAVPRARARHRPCALRDQDGGLHALETLRGLELELVSGLGNPQAFEDSVVALGARVRQHRRLPDHHAYQPSDLEGLGGGGRMLVSSAKDAVKLAPLGARFLALEVEFELTRGAGVLAAQLDALPAPAVRAALHAGLHG